MAANNFFAMKRLVNLQIRVVDAPRAVGIANETDRPGGEYGKALGMKLESYS